MCHVTALPLATAHAVLQEIFACRQGCVSTEVSFLEDLAQMQRGRITVVRNLVLTVKLIIPYFQTYADMCSREH